jgi:hypothetical protein
LSLEAHVDRTALWTPLLQRLTDRFPSWGIWKNADTALAGSGDIDSTAPSEDWPGIVDEFQAWATDRGFGPVTACDHVHGVLFLIALDAPNLTFLELDVNARKYFRGWTLFRPEDLQPVMEMDDRGFRRVRKGAEGVILLLQNGSKWGGRAHHAGLKKRSVGTFLRDDPDGVRMFAELFGPARGAMTRVSEAVARGAWDRPAMLKVEGWSVFRALAEPRVVLWRLRSRPIKKRCPVLRAIFTDDRRIPADVDGWLASVEIHHPLYR